ncbi:cysteine hydrolase [Fodinibius halophilus]|uniref:Cysteine hydrolase family protein n=1 Tax=Fodinibius halophilus TaxID=1736908 RepID=A0A6M1T6V8_9BACT|nr:cysteine hydrolase family protein [Fodinibius halophilus]NGP89917.1 cysteine hydrolase family protein [Fodinibius halophilus]
MMNNEALILIETQNEWLASDGKLRGYIEDEQPFEQSVKNLERLLADAREKNRNVVHVGLQFQSGYPEMGQGSLGLRNAIPNAGTFPRDGSGSNFYESLAPADNEFVVSGRVGSSAFAGSNLDVYLRNNNIDTLYLTGYAMHVCVESTLREAHDRGYNTILISDASAAFTAEQKNYVLNHVVPHFGAHIATDEFINDKVNI